MNDLNATSFDEAAELIKGAKQRGIGMLIDVQPIVQPERSESVGEQTNNNMDDKYQRFLTGHISCRRMSELEGFDDIKNKLSTTLWKLQHAHDLLVFQEANRRLRGVIRGLHEGKITLDQAHELFGLDRAALKELTSPGYDTGSVRCASLKPKKGTAPHAITREEHDQKFPGIARDGD